MMGLVDGSQADATDTSGSRKDAAVLRSHPRLCGMTTTQTCEALQQAHRLLGDTYIKQLPVPCSPQSHMGEHVRQ